MRAIVAMNYKGVIGNEGKIPWKAPEDQQFFQMMTLGQTVIMGRKTYESLPTKPLKRRTNVVMSRNSPPNTDYIVARSPEIAARRYPDGIVIGGLEIYTAMWDYIDTFYVSYIADITLGDTIFPTDRLYADFGTKGSYTFGNLAISVLTRH